MQYTIPQVGDRFEIKKYGHRQVRKGLKVLYAYCKKIGGSSHLCSIPAAFFNERLLIMHGNEGDRILKYIRPKGTLVTAMDKASKFDIRKRFDAIIDKPFIVAESKEYRYKTAKGKLAFWRKYTFDFINS